MQLTGRLRHFVPKFVRYATAAGGGCRQQNAEWLLYGQRRALDCQQNLFSRQRQLFVGGNAVGLGSCGTMQVLRPAALGPALITTRTLLSGTRALSTQPQPAPESALPGSGERPVETLYQPVKDAPPKSDPNYPWKWHSFLPEHTYKPNLNVDLRRHVQPTGVGDRFAFYTVKFLRFFADALFRKRYGHRAVVLETVAAVPGMVGGMMLHLQCLRRFRQSGGWIRVLLDEAENERMHLMVYMSIAQPTWLERLLVITAQAGFFSFYTLLYTLSPKTAHRMVGYLEEEAIVSYTEYLKEIDEGRIPNIPAPPIAIDYWQLSPDARLREVVLATRADEAHHRDVNHLRANLIKAHRGDPAPYSALKHDDVDPHKFGA
jgi:ubiquinol oxidase